MIVNALITVIMSSPLADGVGQISWEASSILLRVGECSAIHHILHMLRAHAFDSVMDAHSRMGSLE